MDASKTHSFAVTLTIPKTPNRRKRKAKAPRTKKNPVRNQPKATVKKRTAKPKAKKNIPVLTQEEQRETRLEYDRARNQTPERQEKNRRYSRQWKALAKELGLCVGCHGIPLPNRTRCQQCTDRHREYRRRAKEEGRCTDCGWPPVPDRTRCEVCAANRRKNRQRAKETSAQTVNPAPE